MTGPYETKCFCRGCQCISPEYCREQQWAHMKPHILVPKSNQALSGTSPPLHYFSSLAEPQSLPWVTVSRTTCSLVRKRSWLTCNYDQPWAVRPGPWCDLSEDKIKRRLVMLGLRLHFWQGHNDNADSQWGSCLLVDAYWFYLLYVSDVQGKVPRWPRANEQRRLRLAWGDMLLSNIPRCVLRAMTSFYTCNMHKHAQ